MVLPELFRLYREYLGMSQAELAVAMGTTQTSVARWELTLSPISGRTASHIKALVQARFAADFSELVKNLLPEMTVSEFVKLPGFFGTPSAKLRQDEQGNHYLGLVLIDGHREHALYVKIDDHKWFGIDREGTATKIDREFMKRFLNAARG